MNNNNPNSNSPLDEIKRITKESSPNQRRRTVSQNTTPPPKESVPTVKPKEVQKIITSPVQRPAPAVKSTPNALPKSSANQASVASKPTVKAVPVQNTKAVAKHDVIIPLSEKDIIKAQNTVHAQQPVPNKNIKVSDQTQVMKNVNNINPHPTAVPVANKKEAHNIKNGSADSDNAQNTRISDTVAQNNQNSEQKSNMKTKAKNTKKQGNSMASQYEESIGRGLLFNSVKAIVYLVSVFVISGCLSLFVIFVGNDCFALVKSDVEIEVTLPKNADLDDIAEVLHDNEIIKYPSIFKMYVNLRKKDTNNYLSGKFTVSGSMSYDTLIAKFKPYSTREEVTITIVEGSTTQDIIDLFVNQGIGTQEGFEKAINEYEYDFWFLENLSEEKTANRIYRLDGYLFPDTYNFFTDSKEEDIIYKLLSNFDMKFDKDNLARLDELGMSLDDIIILASMIQSEAKYVSNNPHADNGSDYALVSAVFHNRLNNPNYDGIGGKLQSDATVKYVLDYYGDDMDLATALKSYESPYNTYLNKGLPAGPISNPSLNAINFAMNPDMIYGKNFYYFISNSQGYNYYATTANEHARNVEKVKSESAD
ncbi:MAG: endolytic transglycosylase MltG [Clostridia bacterium]|nr:endolytic transglycosylase MltG [Clostridia bacterium]